MPLSVFQVLFKANFIFKDFFKTVLYIQVLFKHVIVNCELELHTMYMYTEGVDFILNPMYWFENSSATGHIGAGIV